jgi:hypothetical protein
VRGFLVAAKFERNQDHDIHVQMAASPEWEQDQLIIEIPAGGKYCPVRKALWALVRADREKSGSKSKADTIKFEDPTRSLRIAALSSSTPTADMETGAAILFAANFVGCTCIRMRHFWRCYRIGTTVVVCHLPISLRTVKLRLRLPNLSTKYGFGSLVFCCFFL